MSKTFRFSIPGKPEEFISKAREVARENNVAINGDSTRGSVAGSGAEGDYRVEGNTAVLTINKKPFFAPWWLVESELNNFFRPPSIDKEN